MASSIIHCAITRELIRKKRFTDNSRLMLGSVLPDSGNDRNSSHMIISVAGLHRKTYDFDRYRYEFGKLMNTDNLYLGYYLHLVQDALYRHFMYDKYHWNPHIPGNVEKLHRDYAAGNRHIIEKYGLKNDFAIPSGFDIEPINNICAFDLVGLLKRMNTYFVPVENDGAFFFTKEMADEYIAEAVEYCIRVLDNLKKGNTGIDGYAVAWNSAPRSILESTLNTRDLGMYRIGGTKEYTVADRIYRSDRCDALSPRDKELLLGRGITTVIDLRSDEEAFKRPSAFANDGDFDYRRFPIEEGRAPPASLDEVPVSYMRIAHAEHMRDVFRAIANAPGGVLCHCTAGKDRTGVVSAILLSLAGVSDEDIVFDYAISREFNKSRLEAFLKEHPEIDREIVLANEKSMYSFLDMMRKRHGSAERYLAELGIAEADIQRLKDKLTKRAQTG